MDPTNEGNSCINQLGGVFLNGRPLPPQKRRMMIELASEGVRPCQISQILKVSSGCISKILSRYKKTGLVCPKATGGSRPRRLTPDVISMIVEHKIASPTIFAWEIRQRLVAARACEAEKIPSVSSINRILRKMKVDTLASDGVYAEIVNAVRVQGRRVSGAEHLVAPKSSRPLQDSTQQRSRTHFSSKQVETLEQEFLHSHYPDLVAREEIATQINVSEDTIKVWFSNRRAKFRRESQTKLNNFTSHGAASLPCDYGRFTLAHRDTQHHQSHSSEMAAVSLTQTCSDNSTLICWPHYHTVQPTFPSGYPHRQQPVQLAHGSISWNCNT